MKNTCFRIIIYGLILICCGCNRSSIERNREEGIRRKEVSLDSNPKVSTSDKEIYDKLNKLKHDETVKYPKEVEEKLTNIMDKIVEIHRRISDAKISCTTKKENCVQIKELEDNIRRLQKEYGQLSAPYLEADGDNKVIPFVYPIGPLEKKGN